MMRAVVDVESETMPLSLRAHWATVANRLGTLRTFFVRIAEWD